MCEFLSVVMNETEEICRFCLKTIEKPLPIDEKVKEIIEILMLKLDLRISPEHVMCYGCAETLKTALDFKSACIYTEDCLYPFIEGKNETRLDLWEIYFKVNDSKDVVSVEGREVCRFCMKLSDSDRCTPIDMMIEKNMEIKKLLENYLPEVIMGAIEKPVACENCYNFLRQYSLFVTSFSHVEQQIQSHAIRTLGRDCVGEIDLRQVRDFSLDKLIKREVETIDNAKVAKNGLEIFNEIESKEKIVFEKENQMNENNTLILIYPSMIFYGNAEIKPTVVETSYNPEEANHTVIERVKGPDQDASELETNLHVKGGVEDVTETIHRCQLCPYKAQYKCVLARHMLIHKDISEVKAYPCKLCPFKSKWMYSLTKHMLTHKDISEVTTYDCNFCSYKAKRKIQLKIHMLTHKDNPKARLKQYLTKHMLVHKDISEVTNYQCALCPYKTKRRYYLTQHMLIHKDFSEVTTYDCNFCSFKTKRKSSLKIHMLVHTDNPKNAARTIHHCKQCPYEAKRKSELAKHMLVHKDISEVTTYDCNRCSFKTKHKYNLTTHILTHKDNPKNAAEIGTDKSVKDVEETIHHCKHCPYKTKLKRYLTKHMLVHKDISEVKAYRCKLCPYKTKRKECLTSHTLIHKDPSEVTTYHCNVCLFKTKHKSYMRRHMLTHQDKPKVTYYQSKLCPYPDSTAKQTLM
ncbi:hypothetical protein NQ318_000024 [Aromia moschata]|uniref:Uncharacterized protein n=1 Tax=Aromia moschata TaxID=1265417 RepID=A0AAV8YCF0_9CUCU|nr:hypothetical protein NQ318_000024 [Aromia moschata]